MYANVSCCVPPLVSKLVSTSIASSVRHSSVDGEVQPRCLGLLGQDHWHAVVNGLHQGVGGRGDVGGKEAS